MSFIMSSFEFNKILAAIILALVVVGIISKIGNVIVNSNKIELKETAYKIDIPKLDVSTAVSSTTSATEIESILALLATASLENGEKVYKKCGACHNYEKGSKAKIGPNLWNIVNRSKANTEGFGYSKSLSEYGGIWSYEELNNFLFKPKEYITGTKMNFAGLKKAQDRADLILWLRQQSDNPVSLP
tara:strand:- start:6 stop:566 length:561 start_codon:yes stop_codon:yes gene_type:complete